MKYKVMIIEDDEVIASTLKRQLGNWDLEGIIADDFKNILEELIACDPALVLIDISLPYYNGYKWCEDIRKISKVPIIFISSMSDNLNIVMAMNMGADDFVVKPFNVDVLIAKILALLRRSYDYKVNSDLKEYKGLILDVGASLLYYNDQKVELTKNELKIMIVLFDNHGRIVSREQLMQKLWESDYYVDDNTLSVNMTRIRKKLESIKAYDVIKTKKGQGYIID